MTKYFEMIDQTDGEGVPGYIKGRLAELTSPPEFDMPPATVSFREMIGEVSRLRVFLREDLWDD